MSIGQQKCNHSDRSAALNSGFRWFVGESPWRFRDRRPPLRLFCLCQNFGSRFLSYWFSDPNPRRLVVRYLRLGLSNREVHCQSAWLPCAVLLDWQVLRQWLQCWLQGRVEVGGSTIFGWSSKVFVTPHDNMLNTKIGPTKKNNTQTGPTKNRFLKLELFCWIHKILHSSHRGDGKICPAKSPGVTWIPRIWALVGVRCMRRLCSQGEIGMQNEKRRCSLPFAHNRFFFSTWNSRFFWQISWFSDFWALRECKSCWPKWLFLRVVLKAEILVDVFNSLACVPFYILRVGCANFKAHWA